MEPPMAIICRCLPFSFRANGDMAVARAAASASKTLPSAPMKARAESLLDGSRLKLSSVRARKLRLTIRSGCHMCLNSGLPLIDISMLSLYFSRGSIVGGTRSELGVASTVGDWP